MNNSKTYIKSLEKTVQKLAAENKTLRAECQATRQGATRMNRALKTMLDSSFIRQEWYLSSNWGYVISSLALKGYEQTRREIRNVPPHYKEQAAQMIKDAEKAISTGTSVFNIRNKAINKGRHNSNDSHLGIKVV